MCRSRFIFETVFCGGEYATAVAPDAAGTPTSRAAPSPRTSRPEDPVQTVPNGPSDAYVIKLGPAGQSLYATRLGGSSYDEGADIHADLGRVVYLLGTPLRRLPHGQCVPRHQAPGFDFVFGSFIAKLSETAARADEPRPLRIFDLLGRRGRRPWRWA